jgi:hypothetical protein
MSPLLHLDVIPRFACLFSHNHILSPCYQPILGIVAGRLVHDWFGGRCLVKQPQFPQSRATAGCYRRWRIHERHWRFWSSEDFRARDGDKKSIQNKNTLVTGDVPEQKSDWVALPTSVVGSSPWTLVLCYL